jgi:hypothetical protein
MIYPGAVIAIGKPVVAVGPQRRAIDAGMPRPARIGELLSRQPTLGAALRPLLPHGGPVLVSIGVAARAIQCPLTRPRAFRGPHRSRLLVLGAGDLLDV